MMLIHTLPLLADNRTKLIIMGTFPSEAALAREEFYASPTNQFWDIIGALIRTDLRAMPYDTRIKALKKNRIGIWNIYASCERVGSLDANIRNACLQDFSILRKRAPSLEYVFFNGNVPKKALRMLESMGYDCSILPSTSAAHASRSIDEKKKIWKKAFSPIKRS